MTQYEYHLVRENDVLTATDKAVKAMPEYFSSFCTYRIFNHSGRLMFMDDNFEYARFDINYEFFNPLSKEIMKQREYEMLRGTVDLRAV
jgi:hypothetical protein